jgi:hypothetical protein
MTVKEFINVNFNPPKPALKSALKQTRNVPDQTKSIRPKVRFNIPTNTQRITKLVSVNFNNPNRSNTEASNSRVENAPVAKQLTGPGFWGRIVAKSKEKEKEQ